MQSRTIAELTTRLHAAEKALERCEHLAIAGRYAGAIMHEVNNPLEALNNLVFLAKNRAEHPAQVVEYMEMAEAQLRHLGEITRKTLGFYKEQSEAKDFDLAEIMNSALTLHAQRTQLQNVQVQRRVRGPALAKVYAGEVLQVFSNLILNALDAVPAHNAVLCIRVKPQGENIVVTFADNGVGIEKAVYKTLFQEVRSTKSHGTGLGLWHSRNIILKHRGAICCRSTCRPGRSGTTIRLSLPASLA